MTDGLIAAYFRALVFKRTSFDLRHVSVVFESKTQCLPRGRGKIE